jgi:hypothetical protein
MYAYAKVIIERPKVRALPVSTLTHSGDQNFCWMYEKGHAERTEIRIGVSDGEWIEVTNRLHPPTSKAEHPWKRIDGSEKVITGDLSLLADGEAVEIGPSRPEQEIASASASTGP